MRPRQGKALMVNSSQRGQMRETLAPWRGGTGPRGMNVPNLLERFRIQLRG